VPVCMVQAGIIIMVPAKEYCTGDRKTNEHVKGAVQGSCSRQDSQALHFGRAYEKTHINSDPPGQNWAKGATQHDFINSDHPGQNWAKGATQHDFIETVQLLRRKLRLQACASDPCPGLRSFFRVLDNCVSRLAI